VQLSADEDANDQHITGRQWSPNLEEPWRYVKGFKCSKCQIRGSLYILHNIAVHDVFSSSFLPNNLKSNIYKTISVMSVGVPIAHLETKRYDTFPCHKFTKLLQILRHISNVSFPWRITFTLWTLSTREL